MIDARNTIDVDDYYPPVGQAVTTNSSLKFYWCLLSYPANPATGGGIVTTVNEDVSGWVPDLHRTAPRRTCARPRVGWHRAVP
jgi:hypothetical protein